MRKSILKFIAILIASLSIFGCSNSERGKIMMEGSIANLPEERRVIEFFMYTCPHCRKAEPTVRSWQAKQNLLFQQGIYVFEQVPAIFSANWGSDTKAGEKEAMLFYTLRRMGLEQQMRDRIFEAIQEKGLDAGDPQSLAEFLKREGIPAQEFAQTLKSPEVTADVRRAEFLTKQYSVFSVPSFVLFNRKLILMNEYPNLGAVENALLNAMKEHYTKSQRTQ